MRSHRIALFVGWLVVSSLAVIGFAAFTTDSEPSPFAEAPSVTVSPEIGRSTGAVAAMTFALLAEGANAAEATGFDAVTQAAAESDGATTSLAPTTTESNGIVDRSRFFDETQIRTLVGTFFRPEDVSRAIRIAWCESSFNPENVNPVTGASGLFQHAPDTWAARSSAAGYTGADILDPEANVAVAAWMLYELPGGWSHWQCQA
ncbi:MAG: transglycosylase SLT domain-containing protein [Acidimicrobiia bacterium]|nr:transglycosylase SLT domain-containing protein [Acidimicrobiia bacterium]